MSLSDAFETFLVEMDSAIYHRQPFREEFLQAADALLNHARLLESRLELLEQQIAFVPITPEQLVDFSEDEPERITIPSAPPPSAPIEEEETEEVMRICRTCETYPLQKGETICRACYEAGRW